jgi:hypothetical protein
VKTSVILTSIVMGAFASEAVAYDFSIKGSVNETVDGSKNYFLSSTPSGATAKSTTAATLDFLAQTATTRYLLDTNFSYYKYFGPGAADVPQTWDTPLNVNFSVGHVTELTTYNFSAFWNRADVATTLLAQSGFSTGTGSVNTYGASGGISQDLSRTDTVSWSANASTVSYTDPTQIPSKDLTTGVTWNHGLSQTSGLVNSVIVDWFASDDAANSQRLFWKLTSGLQSQLSSRLIFNANVGVGFANAWQSAASQVVTAPPVTTGPFAPITFQPQAGTGNSILANVSLTYDLLKSTKVTLTAAQSVAPLITGQLQKSDSVALALNYNINYFSNLSLTTQITHVPASTTGSAFGSPSSSSDFFSAAVSYGYRLSREWTSLASYTYLAREGGGNADASIILFSLTRDLSILGNPTAINQADAERARQRQQNSAGYVFPNFH